MAAIGSTSDVDTYILTGNVKKQCFLQQIKYGRREYTK